MGMINLCENEDELAAVLAHEVGLVVLEHPIKAVSNATKQASLVNIAKIAAAKAAVK
jgi:predicted Zn-dependent protease